MIIRLDNSAKALLLTNIAIAAIALLLNWDIWAIIAGYWVQSMIIGFFTVLKIIFYKENKPMGKMNQLVWKLPISGFFIMHYGIFHLGYGIFLIVIAAFEPASIVERILDLALVAALFFANHAYSFYKNYMQEPSDFKKFDNVLKFMWQPYARIIPMHATIIAAVFAFTYMNGLPKSILLLFLALKTVADLLLHAREHKQRLF